MRHAITKIRREPVRRALTVAKKVQVTPRLLRIEFSSSELENFDSPSPDDHIKIFLPATAGEEPRRDFTPRAWNIATGMLALEFALHDHGPATAWARAARVGDSLVIGGPRGSTIVADDFDWYLLIGDSSALPSIVRRLEELRADVPVLVYVLVADEAEQQQLQSAAAVEAHWLYTGEESIADARRVCAALELWQAPAGDGYVWIAGESAFSRELYQYMVEVRKHPAAWVKAAAYWTVVA